MVIIKGFAVVLMVLNLVVGFHSLLGVINASLKIHAEGELRGYVNYLSSTEEDMGFEPLIKSGKCIERREFKQ